jgi:hypothetical protein
MYLGGEKDVQPEMQVLDKMVAATAEGYRRPRVVEAGGGMDPSMARVPAGVAAARREENEWSQVGMEMRGNDKVLVLSTHVTG